jgi:hypothetical protein
VIKEVQDGEYIITTKQPYARAHFFIDEELDEHDETPNLPVGSTFQCPMEAAPEEETKCVV